MPDQIRGADCVIVGGGIGGAVLALALGQRSHRVVVLERERVAAPVSRPEVLELATLHAFRSLGVGERIARETLLPLERIDVLHAGQGRLFSLEPEVLRRTGTRPHSTDPSKTRQILLEVAGAHAEVLRGVDVQGLLHDGGRVCGVRAQRDGASLTVHAPLVVGDDGPRSRVRQDLGISLPTHIFPLDFVTAAGPVLAGLPSAGGEVWIDPAGLRRGLFALFLLPLPGGRTTMVFAVSPAAYRRFAASPPSVFHDAAARLSPRAGNLSAHYPFPEAFTHVTRPFGHAERYVTDGAALIGDAAHPVTPVGGQGANMSVADAMALAATAHDALTRGDVSASALHAYERVRRGPNDRALRFSARADRVVRTLGAIPGLAAWLLPAWLKWIDRSDAIKDRLSRAVGQTFETPKLEDAPA